MKYIVTKGKTISEAIYSGLRILGSTKNSVEIEVLQKEKERLFFSKKAIVKLTKKEKQIREGISNFVDDFFILQEYECAKALEQESADETEGKAWIKDGKVLCKSTKGVFPTLTIPEKMTVLINGKEFNEKTIILSDSEKYEIHSEETLQETEWKVSMDPDKLKVDLHVKPGFRMNYQLMDSEPKQHLTPSVIDNKQVTNSLQLQEIIAELKTLQVTTGFRHAEMIEATEAIEEGMFVIASGKPPQQGENGWFELMVNTEMEKGLKENEDGKVDFREVKKIPVVEKGSLIGIIHPPTLGKIGYTVTNETIPCKQTYPLKVQAGKGIIILNDKVVATQSGRPHIEQRGLLVNVSIIQKFTHVGDVDLSSGNITFKGDVEVFGEVTDHMCVDACGEVEIHKSVNNATINANGSVKLHSNCNGSTIVAGEKDLLVKDWIAGLTRISTTMDKILAMLEAVTNSESFKNSPYKNNIQPLLRSLILKKFHGFPDEVKSFVDTVHTEKSHLVDDTWKNIRSDLHKCFLSLEIDIKFEYRLQQLHNEMKDLLESYDEMKSTESCMSVPNAMNSNFFCTGDLHISDKGCINTKIQSGGYVHITGVVRGGRVYGEKGITVGEAGSINSSLTILSTSHDHSITIGRAMEGVVLRIGNETYRFTEEVFNVRAFINSDDRMIVNYK
ncbi:flagellar assembly protein A [Sporosarcina sp. UB5]|uniref:DUF342 domain-containing protein n=1 Tax=Sporosarcina sp. UB5 TaxID=3047463 RepID=UPI003D7B0187